MDSSIAPPSKKRLTLITFAYLVLFLALSIISGFGVLLGVSTLRFVFQKLNLFSFQPSDSAFWLSAYTSGEIMVILTAWICFRFSIRDSHFFQKLALPKSKVVCIGLVSGIFLFGISALFSYLTRIIYGDLEDPIIERFLYFSPLYKIFFAIVISLIAPICEEILFRRALFGVFRQYGCVKSGIIISSILFTIIHFNTFFVMGIFYFAAIFIAGIVLAIIYHKTDSIYTSIIAHILNNFLNFILIFYWFT